MNIVKREKIIPPQPEKTVEETVYIACDGKEFYSESTCKLYEDTISTKSHPVYKSHIEVHTFFEEHTAHLYYLRSEDDYQFLVSKIIGTRYLNIDQWNYTRKPGWYLYIWTDGGDYADSHDLYLLEEYEKECRDLLREWISTIDEKINEHSFCEGAHDET